MIISRIFKHASPMCFRKCYTCQLEVRVHAIRHCQNLYTTCTGTTCHDVRSWGVTLTWGQILTSTFQGQQRSASIYFDALRREEHDGFRIISLALLVQKLLAKKNIFVIWPLMTSGDPNIGLSEKLSEIVSKWFLMSFRTFFSRFSLRRLRAA